MSPRRLAVAALCCLAPTLMAASGAGATGAASDGSGATSGYADCVAQENVPPRIAAIGFSTDPADADPSSPTVTAPAGDRVRLGVRLTDLGGPGPASGVDDTDQSIEVVLARTDAPDITAPATLLPSPAEPGLFVGDLGLVSHLATAEDAVGTWRIRDLRTQDDAGNLVVYTTRTPVDPTAGEAPFSASGVDSPSFTITSRTGPAPAAPSVTILSKVPARIDAGRGRDFRVRVRVDSSEPIGTVALEYVDRADREHDRTLQLTGVPGSDGVYTGTVDLPRWSRDAHHVLSLVQVYAFTASDPALLGQAFFRPRTIDLTSKPDRTAPRVDRVRISSTADPVDLRAGAQVLTVRARVSDAGAGAAEPYVFVTTRPDSGRSGTVVPSQEPARLISGDRSRGVWRARILLDHCAVSGAGRLEIGVGGLDRAVGTNVHTARVRGPRYVSGPAFQAPALPEAASGPAGGVTVTFAGPALGISTSSVVLYDAAGAVVAGTWACSDAAGAAVGCVSGPAGTAVFTPDSGQGAPTQVRYNPPGVLDLRSASGVPVVATYPRRPIEVG